MPDMILSGPHKRFAEGIAGGMNGTAAYRAAYPEANYNSARTRGAALFANVDIVSEIERLRSAVEAEFKLTKVQWLEWLRSVASKAEADGDYAATKGCLREIGLAMGWYAPSKLKVEAGMDIVVHIGTPGGS